MLTNPLMQVRSDKISPLRRSTSGSNSPLKDTNRPLPMPQIQSNVINSPSSLLSKNRVWTNLSNSKAQSSTCMGGGLYIDEMGAVDQFKNRLLAESNEKNRQLYRSCGRDSTEMPLSSQI